MKPTAAPQPIRDRSIILRWTPAIHNPSGKIFIACDRQNTKGGMVFFDHYGNQYPFSECTAYPMHYGFTQAQCQKISPMPEFSPLQQCWERAKAIAWEVCPLKVGDIVSPIYGKQAGMKFAVELFDHSDRTVGIDNFQRWYPIEYLDFAGKAIASLVDKLPISEN